MWLKIKLNTGGIIQCNLHCTESDENASPFEDYLRHAAADTDPVFHAQ